MENSKRKYRENVDYLIKVRKQRGISQREMAEQIGVTVVSFNAYERLRSEPSASRWFKWLEILVGTD